MAQIQQYLDTIRTAESGENVRDAIVQALDKIHGDNPVTVTQRTAKMPQSGDLIINAEGGTAYDQITVHPADGSKGAMTLTELTATENKEYIPDDNEYYSKVIVNVPQLNNDIMEDVLEVTENDVTIYATEEGFDGFSAIHVNISNIPVSGQFEVEFYDTDKITLLDRQLVPAYGNANYRGPYIPQDPGGKAFAGWNPSPVNVTKNMKCYPNFTQRQMMPGEISEDWDIICAKGGAGYPLGAYKDLYFSATFTVEELTAVGATGYTSDQTITFEVEAIKVAEGEDGSKSTWITQPSTFGFNKEKWSISAAADRQLDWEHCNFRKWLQLLFTKFAPIFIQHIKPVYKYSQNSTATMPPYSILTTQDYLWAPSVKEMCIDTDYWHKDLSYLFYDTSMTYEAQKAKYYDGVPLALPYFNDLGLTPAQRDVWFYMGPGQSYINYNIGYLRDRVAIFNDRHSAFPQNATSTYVDPTTGDTVTARYIADANNQGYGSYDPDLHFLGFCLV